MTMSELLDLLPLGEDAALDDAAADCVDAWFSDDDDSAFDAHAAPSSLGLAKLLDAAKSSRRFLGATDDLAELFDVTGPEAEAMLLALDDDAEWTETLPGIRVKFAAGGPGLGASIASFLEVAPGTTFPLHDHEILETSILLQGCCREDSGLQFGAGDVIRRMPGQAHAFTALGGRPSVFALKSGSLTFLDVDA